MPLAIRTRIALFLPAGLAVACAAPPPPPAALPAASPHAAPTATTAPSDTPSAAAAAPPAPAPKVVEPEKAFVLAARFEDRTTLAFVGGKVYALVSQTIFPNRPPKSEDEELGLPFWVHVFELRGTKFQKLTKRKIEGGLLVLSMVERNGKPYLAARDPNSRAAASFYEPLDGSKRLPGEWDDRPETPMPPSCEDPPTPGAKMSPMRDLYRARTFGDTSFLMGTSCDGKPKLQIVRGDGAQMMAVESSAQIMDTWLGVVLQRETGAMLYDKGTFTRITPSLPENTEDLLRAPDGALIALGWQKHFGLRGDTWTPWILEDGRADFWIVSDGVSLWAYPGRQWDNTTETLWRYAPPGAKPVEMIDTSAVDKL